MYRFIKHTRAVVVALAGLVFVSQTGAQTPMPKANTMSGHEGADSAQLLVNFITTVNRDEIALGKLALAKASRADVKAYAQKMIDDHTNAMTAWAQKVPAQSLTIPDSAQTATKPAQAMAGTAAMADGISEVRDTSTKARGGVAPAAMHNANLKTMDELKQLSGAAFDAKYLDAQIEGHAAVLKELTLRPITYTDLQTLLTTFRTTVENHEIAAKKLKGMP